MSRIVISYGFHGCQIHWRYIVTFQKSRGIFLTSSLAPCGGPADIILFPVIQRAMSRQVGGPNKARHEPVHWFNTD